MLPINAAAATVPSGITRGGAERWGASSGAVRENEGVERFGALGLGVTRRDAHAT